MVSTAKTYAIDPAHTTVEFIVRHMMISKVRGRFTDVAGTVALADDANGVPSAIDVTIATKSIDTREAQRDGHLQSPDFFDAAQFPQLTFKSTAIAAGNGGEFSITGDLTMHGVTKSVTLAATYEGSSKDPYGNTRIGYEAHGTVSRKDFGLTWNAALETGGVAVGDEIKIEINLEALPQT